MTFPQRLRSVIGDLTLDEFARLLGEPDHRVKNIIREVQKPPSDFLIKVHDVCSVDLNWLLTGAEGSIAPEITARERALLENFRAASAEGQAAIEATSIAVAKKPAAKRVRKAA